MTILDYNRVLRDSNGHTPDQLLAELRNRCAVTASDRPVRPAAANEFGMYLAGRWYKLTLRPDLVPGNDPIGRLPITLLTRNVIEPLLGVTDPRTDKRIDFVGGGTRAGRARAPRFVRRDGGRFRALPDANGRSDGGGGCRRDHAAEVNLVRAEAGRRHGQPRAGLTHGGGQTTNDGKETTDDPNRPSALCRPSLSSATAGSAPRTGSRHRAWTAAA